MGIDGHGQQRGGGVEKNSLPFCCQSIWLNMPRNCLNCNKLLGIITKFLAFLEGEGQWKIFLGGSTP